MKQLRTVWLVFPTVVCIGILMESTASMAQTPDGPFGLRMGMSRAELDAAVGAKYKESEPGYLQELAVPRPHPDFESYSAIVTQTYGLCKLNALGKVITINSFGDQLRSSFDTITEALQERYGKPKIHDYVKSGSIFTEKQYWALSLLKKERVLAAIWEGRGIVLQAIAVSSDTGGLHLSYEKDFEPCLKEQTKSQRSVF